MAKKSAQSLSRSGMLVDGELVQLPPVAMYPKTSPWPTVLYNDGSSGFRAQNTWVRVDTLLREGKRGDRRSGQVSLKLKVMATEVVAGADREELKEQMLNPEFTEWLMGFPAGWTDVA